MSTFDTDTSLRHSTVLTPRGSRCFARASAYALPMPSVAPVTTAHSPYCLKFRPPRMKCRYRPPSVRREEATMASSVSATETTTRAAPAGECTSRSSCDVISPILV